MNHKFRFAPVAGAQPAPGGVLPFKYGGKPLAAERSIGSSFIPGNVSYRIIVFRGGKSSSDPGARPKSQVLYDEDIFRPWNCPSKW